ncbi:MAG: dTDP-4-dehydrorhamnose reductase [Thaumarchaeota archaeon]|nr:dTDP-4-dehydrorhamnose reductase [Nitrososphaerota archaeon]
MKFLVTGSTGLVGRQVVKDLTEKNHEVYSCYHNQKPQHGNPIHLDLTDLSSIETTIEQVKPDVIIHLAAMTDVDGCEAQKDLAFLINAQATEKLAKQAALQNAFFVYVSTDYVFDGTKELWKENDKPNPLGNYGKSKLGGEKALGNLASSYCIARISTPFGLHPKKKGFPLWVAENLKSKKEINVLVDQFTSPTYTPNLSKMLIEISERQLLGIFHVSGASRISRYELAELVCEKLNLDKKFLKPSTIDEIKWKAKRPKDSSLDVSNATYILNEKPQKIEDSLNLFIKELNQN